MSRHIEALERMFSDLDEAGDLEELTAAQAARLKRDADKRRAERREASGWDK